MDQPFTFARFPSSAPPIPRFTARTAAVTTSLMPAVPCKASVIPPMCGSFGCLSLSISPPCCLFRDGSTTLVPVSFLSNTRKTCTNGRIPCICQALRISGGFAAHSHGHGSHCTTAKSGLWTTVPTEGLATLKCPSMAAKIEKVSSRMP